MRVIAGLVRGRKLQTVAGDQVRPTSDRAKEALFSILESRFDLTGIDVLDLYAGSGALGIEALSRGAATAVFVESNPVVVRVLQRNLEACRMQGRILTSTAARALVQLEREQQTFAGVFIDPPYASSEAETSLTALGDGALLAADAWVVVEHDVRKELPSSVGKLRLILTRRYGTSVLSFFGKDG